MPPDTDILASLGLDQLVSDDQLARDTQGILRDPAGARVVFAGAESLRSLHRVVEGEQAGVWSIAMKTSGHTCGRAIAADLETKLAALGKPALAALPLEACLVFIERHFSIHGWGRLKLDLTFAAEHGLVVARVEHSCLVEALPAGSGFADPVLAGMLQGFFEHISGQSLGCEEIACARHPAPSGAPTPLCTFVITAPERLAALAPRFGQETAEALLTRLRS